MRVIRLEQAADQHILDGAREAAVRGAAPLAPRVGEDDGVLLRGQLRQGLPQGGGASAPMSVAMAHTRRWPNCRGLPARPGSDSLASAPMASGMVRWILGMDMVGFGVCCIVYCLRERIMKLHL